MLLLLLPLSAAAAAATYICCALRGALKSDMGSSDHAITDHENLETGSTLETETVTGSHTFTVDRYSLTKGMGIGKCINSDAFSIGGYKWMIKYYPDGVSYQDTRFISFFLEFQSGAGSSHIRARAQFSFTILARNGAPSNMRQTSELLTFSTFNSATDTSLRGCTNFVKRTEFEASDQCLKDDTFTVKCTVTVVKAHRIEANNYDYNGIIVPLSNLNKDLASLLESDHGADVTFVVKEEKFSAHRWMLAARSDVFRAELFGGMKEKRIGNTIKINDIEPPAFKYMLYFIYSDSLPAFEVEGKKHYLRLIQHLLVAADRYQLERLRLMCEDLLCKNLCVSDVATTLILAERHNCSELKAQCLGYMNSSFEVFKAVACTDAFNDLMKIFPSILKDD